MRPIGVCMDERNRLSFDTPEPDATTEQIVQAIFALRACGRCPLTGRCPMKDPIGVIADGVPYNHKGAALPRCERCDQWVFGRKTSQRRCRLCADRNDVVAVAA